MPHEPRNDAVHYFFLLKDDKGDQQKLWSLIAPESRVPAEAALSLGLTGQERGHPGQCRIIQEADGDGVSYCLLSLDDLAVIRAYYREAADSQIVDRWQAIFKRIEEDRSRARGAGVEIFGETTLLLSGGSPDGLTEIMGILPGDRTLISDIGTGGGDGRSSLAHKVGHGERGRDFYILATDDADGFLAGPFLQVDALLKKLGRIASHFGHQRRTIIEQRNHIDNDVGKLLHQEVVSGTAVTDTRQLEERIANLSRMFGLLATDSLLVRQARERLDSEMVKLEAGLAGVFPRGPGMRDEIGSYYLDTYRSDREAAATEARHLDFSRRNAQAAIEVVRTQVELLRAGEEVAIQEQSKQLLSRSLVLQRERLSLQVAAGFVEFVLVFYYVLKSWEGVAGTATIEHITPLVIALVVGSFSVAAAVGTHFLAQALHKKSWKGIGLWLSIAVLVSSTAAMVILTVTNK